MKSIVAVALILILVAGNAGLPNELQKSKGKIESMEAKVMQHYLLKISQLFQFI